MLKSKERGEGKLEENPNKVKTRQGKVNCNVNLKKERRLTRLDHPQAWRWRQKMTYTPCLMKMKNVICPSNSPATAPENVLDGNNSITTLGLQVQSVVASVFSPQGWLEGLYRTLGELAKDCSFLLFKQSTKQNKSLCVPKSTKWLSSTRFHVGK